MKIKLALLFVLFGLSLQGMNLDDSAKENIFQLRSALKHAVKLPAERKSNCIIAYLKSTSHENSAGEMFNVTKQAIEHFGTNIKNVDYHTHILMFPNKELTINKDRGFDAGLKVIPEENVNFSRFMVPEKKWKNESQLSQTGYGFVTGFGRAEAGCNLTAYIIPRNNIIPMTHHLAQINGLNNLEVPMVIIADSALEDDTVTRELSKDNLICATFGVKDIKDTQPTCAQCSKPSYLSRGVALVFIVGGVLFIYSRLCAYREYLDRLDKGYVGGCFYPLGMKIFCDWKCDYDNKGTVFHFLHS